jgi:aminoacrylate hydrolase
VPHVQVSDGCRLYFEIDGEGPSLVLVPGLGGSATFWDSLRSSLRKSYRLLLVDHRGAGRSERPEQQYTIEGLAADVLAVMDHVGIWRTHVVGHSTGGVIAQVMALDEPSRVAGLVLSGTWERPDYRFRTLFQSRLEVLLSAGPSAYQNLTHILGFTPAWMNAHASELSAKTDAAASSLAPLAVTAARIEMLLSFDRLAELHRISSPTLVIGAGDDVMIPFVHSQRLAAAIPGADLVQLEGGHFFPTVMPDRFLGELIEFLKKHDSDCDDWRQ